MTSILGVNVKGVKRANVKATGIISCWYYSYTFLIIIIIAVDVPNILNARLNWYRGEREIEREWR